MATNIYDCIIIGAGPAGLTAALYLARDNKQVAIIDKEGFGGNIAKSPFVENIPGFENISGIDYMTNLYNQVKKYKVNDFIGNVTLIQNQNGLYLVYDSESNVLCGKTVIIAIGKKFRELKLDTKDVYYCVTCDGPLFKNKNVLVVGAGNTGATYALELSNYCKNVYICDTLEKLSCEKSLAEKIKTKENIHSIFNTKIKEVKNKKEKLDSVVFENNEEIKCNGIFSAIGVIPNTVNAPNLVNKNSKGYYTDVSTPGLFIAGDCHENIDSQVVCVESDGYKTAKKVKKFLEGN